MRGYRKRPWMNLRNISIPLIGAVLFLTFSIILLISYKSSSFKQAKKEVYSLYTANRSFDWKKVEDDGLPAIYAKEYGKTATENGVEALKKNGLPYILLLAQFSAPVERVYVTKCELTETEHGKKTCTYEYTVSVRFCLEKGIAALAPEENMEFTGKIRMAKKGLFRWLLDDVTV